MFFYKNAFKVSPEQIISKNFINYYDSISKNIALLAKFDYSKNDC